MCYCHGEYFPMSKESIGKFGFSVVKNKNLKNKYKIYDDNFKKLINSNKKSSKNNKSENKAKKIKGISFKKSKNK